MARSLHKFEHIDRVIIDQAVLNAFKRRSVKCYPKEHIEALLGIFKNKILYIHVIEPLEKGTATKEYCSYWPPEEEFEYEEMPLKYYGTIHTHPNYDMDPSDEDWESSFNTHKEDLCDLIMGISHISIKGTRRFFGFTFYDMNKKIIDFVVAEGKK